MGPQGVLRRAGLNPDTASMAEIMTVLRPIFSNQSAQNIAGMIVGQWREWRSQVENAGRGNLTPEARVETARQSAWYEFTGVRSQFMGLLGSIGENVKDVLLPASEAVATAFRKIAEWIDPRTGNTWARAGLLGAGGLAPCG